MVLSARGPAMRADQPHHTVLADWCGDGWVAAGACLASTRRWAVVRLGGCVRQSGRGNTPRACSPSGRGRVQGSFLRIDARSSGRRRPGQRGPKQLHMKALCWPTPDP